jgi:hypothetical protein
MAGIASETTHAGERPSRRQRVVSEPAALARPPNCYGNGSPKPERAPNGEGYNGSIGRSAQTLACHRAVGSFNLTGRGTI